MSGPNVVRIKRKRNEEAPGTLIVEHARTKRVKGKETVNDDGPIRYELLEPAAAATDDAPAQAPGLFSDINKETAAPGRSVAAPLTRKPVAGSGFGQAPNPTAEYNAKRYHLLVTKSKIRGISKPKGVATFIEASRSKKRLRQAAAATGLPDSTTPVKASAETPKVLKRPGRNAGVKIDKARPAAQDVQMHDQPNDELAGAMMQFAEEETAKEEAAKETVPMVTALPKLSGQRSQALHKQSADNATMHSTTPAADDSDVEMDSEAEYVYDTYKLAPSDQSGTAKPDVQQQPRSIGVLVISEEDAVEWETYLEEDSSDTSPASDEEDENAEDWYGADYPEDELASDDEFNRNAYGYRGRAGSDAEEWDADTGTFSDEEYERQMQPWRKKTPKQFAKYLNPKNGEEEDEEE